MPDLKADLSEEDLLALASSGSSSDDSGLNGKDKASLSCRFAVQLSKKQIDKASKDDSDRFLHHASGVTTRARGGAHFRDSLLSHESGDI